MMTMGPKLGLEEYDQDGATELLSNIIFSETAATSRPIHIATGA